MKEEINMACVQIKGTRQEVVEMLQLFDLMDTKGFCKFDNYVEVEPNNKEHNNFIASIDIHSNTSSAQDTLNDQFVSQMLTGVYND
ncbi:hypothetical protein bcere0016_13420 [Bacillus cereus 95/8201]|jgi:hypothetical protein|nr:conserved hypothetical protein [Bacillus thuringiensis str. Al Hakam]AHK37504.1 Group-specific protein [Bacillus anthracis str. SVA11]EEK57388.1 hypothetical protein bcere0004_12590 [Bacillus cereus BGSC 6E1]EEK68733.1 hypothetical protein bcere0006_12470 [Bacillus wiedmannii]EEL17964.1 hypothetical protein bcere0016_13420 [Bacillus cereus 95/8201]EEL46595.1 hypothetical protein bcere0021_12770 [Bacillus cereus Rock3-42]EEM60797.1 hypothetical protein bthur0007_12570 [Bacillus thuringiensi